MAEVSAEANMIRDEIRSALVGLDVATDRLVRVLNHAEEFVRGERQPPRITRMETPAPRASAGGFIQTPAAGPATSIRE